ncbi:probable metalloprotease Arx1p [Diutina catenulata]
MQVAVHQDDADVLLHTKNVLDAHVLEKYRMAGQIAQTALVYAGQLIASPQRPTIPELCVLTDSYIARLLAKGFKSVREKGIAHPTSVEVNEMVSGFAPEITDAQAASYVLSVGDVVKVSLGVHIDGYTANVCHTFVIYPEGEKAPLVGPKADAVCAAHIATETLVAYLGLAVSPEKMPASMRANGSTAITGEQIRSVVDAIAQAYNCVVVPGSKVRRVRRFLAGQAEGIVAEREFKGVVWDESSQEKQLLAQAAGTAVVKHAAPSKTAQSTAIPTDDFVIEAGEVYQIDIRMAGARETGTPGIVTLQEIDHFSGKNGRNEFNCKPSVFVRDFAMTHALRLQSARKLLAQVDKRFSVYPFKLSYCSSAFPLAHDNADAIAQFTKDVTALKLGLAEVHNRHLVQARPVQVAKFIPLKTVVDAANATGRHGFDAAKPVLPGMEIPLPQLGMSSLKLKGLHKHGQAIAVARESATVVLNSVDGEVFRLTGGSTTAPSFVHSEYEMPAELAGPLAELSALAQDQKYGLNVKECKHYRVDFEDTDMNLD